MKIRIISVGSIRNKEICSLTAEYLKRISSYQGISVIEIKEGKAKNTRDCLAEEEKKLIKYVDGNSFTVALGEEGKSMTSMELSSFLADRSMKGKDLDFIVGGTEGLSDKIKSDADMLLSLSPLTMTREFARLFITEQIYRAVKISRGEPYHR